MRRRRAQSGFTLMEIMVAVAILGILAAIALPSFASTSRRMLGETEVREFFGELALREEQYRLEYAAYVSTGANESSPFPANPSASAKTLGSLPAVWTALKVRPPSSRARCTYVVIAGTPTDTPGPMASAQFHFVPPERSWFYLLAQCDLDANAGTNSYYFMSSEDQTVQTLNPGR
jgi:prepilin-type N-terminal cleavage/methylation domain-containing protein